MTREDRIYKLKNGSDTAIWAANEIERLEKQIKDITAPPYRCKYCGSPSWKEPYDQIPPVDYCHEDDHEDTDNTKG